MGDLERPRTLHRYRVCVRGRKVMVGMCVEGVHELPRVTTVAQVSCATCASVAVLSWVAWAVTFGKVVFVMYYFSRRPPLPSGPGSITRDY